MKNSKKKRPGNRGLNYNSRLNVASNAIDPAKPFKCVNKKHSTLGLNATITEAEFAEELKRHKAGEF